MVRPKLTPLIIAGPTGGKKSALALQLAQRFKGEIICADSRQFYHGMSIGTAAPTQAELNLVPHHGYASVDPLTTKVDIGHFLDFAFEKMHEVQNRNHRPIFVGGTGLYLRALRFGISDVPKSNPEVITAIEQDCDKLGLNHLYGELKTKDPETAAKVSPNDRFRIVRAIEILRTCHQSPSSLRKSFHKAKPQFFAHWIYKKPNRESLKVELAHRIEKMFALGLIEEAENLRKRLPKGHWALEVMGYAESLDFLDGKITLEQAKERVLIRHRQYAKRQFTWFNAEPFYRFKIY